MSIFDKKRLKTENFGLHIEGLRRGYFADKYFANITRILEGLNAEGLYLCWRVIHVILLGAGESTHW